jgi:hypothetical protein
MIELLTAIAVWCGEPIGFTTYELVNQCRRELFLCATEPMEDKGRVVKAEAEVVACFGKAKL